MMNEIIDDLLKGVPGHLKKHVLREFFQANALYRVSKSPYAGRLAFMGGTALRIIYDARRYSEDLDFDLLRGEGSDFKFPKLMEAIGSYFNRQNCGCRIKVNERMPVYRAFIRFDKVLFEHKLTPQKDETLSIKFEIDTRPNPYSKIETSVVNKYNLIFPVLKRDLPSLMAGKICAIFKRGYSLGRDFYDLGWFLSKKVKPNFEYLRSEINVDNQQELVKKLLKKVKSLDIGRLIDEIRPFLTNPDELVLLTHLEEIMKNYAEM